MLKSDLEALRDHTIRVNTTTCEIFEVTCLAGHPMRSCIRNSATGRQRTCNKCSVEIDETFYRCKNQCDYDLCKRCAACPQGHILGQANATPAHYYNAGGVQINCAYCSKRIVPQKGYWRCNRACNYDVCYECLSCE